jgi:hypothetical protein
VVSGRIPVRNRTKIYEKALFNTAVFLTVQKLSVNASEFPWTEMTILMKKLILLLITLFFITPCSHGQGVLYFSTFNPAAGVNAPTWASDFFSPPFPPGPDYYAELEMLSGPLLLPVAGSLTTFQSATLGVGADHYVVPVTVQFPDFSPGTSVTLAMRGWHKHWGPTFPGESSDSRTSTFFTVVLGDQANPANLPSSFDGLFIGIVPEPSTVVLGLVGSSLLFFLRRKS